jgi:hypothetical protein
MGRRGWGVSDGVAAVACARRRLEKLAKYRAGAQTKWAATARVRRLEALDHRAAVGARREAEAAAAAADFAGEEAEDAAERAATQTGGAGASSRTRNLGIYGIPQEAGEYGAIRDGGHHPYEDDHDVRVVFSEPDARQVRFELASQNLDRLRGRCATTDAAYMAERGKRAMLDEEEATLRDRGAKNSSDLSDLEAADAALSRALLGPPQRIALPAEADESYRRSQRSHELRDRARGFAARVVEIGAARGLCDTRILHLSQAIAVMREQIAGAEAELAALEAKERALPMIVGRRLADVLTDESSLLAPLDAAAAAAKAARVAARGAAAAAAAASPEAAAAAAAAAGGAVAGLLGDDGARPPRVPPTQDPEGAIVLDRDAAEARAIRAATAAAGTRAGSGAVAAGSKPATEAQIFAEMKDKPAVRVRRRALDWCTASAETSWMYGWMCVCVRACRWVCMRS